jgi:hypothetical protein
MNTDKKKQWEFKYAGGIFHFFKSKNNPFFHLRLSVFICG